jgi:hypothetical protein
MSEKLPWISKPSAAIANSITEAGTTTILITKTPGPLSFVPHNEITREKHKVCP